MLKSCKQTVPGDVTKLENKINNQIEMLSDNLLCFAKAWPLVYQHKEGQIKNIKHIQSTFNLRESLNQRISETYITIKFKYDILTKQFLEEIANNKRIKLLHLSSEIV